MLRIGSRTACTAVALATTALTGVVCLPASGPPALAEPGIHAAARPEPAAARSADRRPEPDVTTPGDAARSAALEGSWALYRRHQAVAEAAGAPAAVATVEKALRAAPHADADVRSRAKAAAAAATRAAAAVRAAAGGLGVITDVGDLESRARELDDKLAALPARCRELAAAQRAWQQHQDEIARQKAYAAAAERAAAEAARAAEAAAAERAAAAKAGKPPATASTPGAPPTSGGTSKATTYRAAAEAFLDTLPGGASARIEWGNPQGHLGGVWMPGSTTIILNAARLDGRLAATKDVLRHEIAHVHQNRTLAATGTSFAAYEDRLDKLFGGNGIERSADAVALLLGARTVRYQSSFTAAQYTAARAILANRVP